MSQIEKWIEVDAPVESVFALFSGLNYFSRWMNGILQVELLEPRRTRWTAQTASGQPIEWEAETTVFEPNRRLAWQATTGPVTLETDATFEPTKRGATLVRALINESEAASANDDGPGSFAARLEADLARFKLFAESEAQERAQQLTRNAAPAAPRFGALRYPGAVIPIEVSNDLPAIHTPRRAIPLEPAGYAYFDNVIPPKAQRPAAARLEAQRRRPITVYLLLGALLALLLGAVWFFLNQRPSNDVAERRAEAGNTSEVSNAPKAPAVGRGKASVSDASAGVQPSLVATGQIAPETSDRFADARASVISAINDWVAATNERDIDRQMSFYPPVVQRYYLQTYFPHNAVRADKQRRLGDADAVRVSIDEPQITWEQEGRVANVRFRKQYEIESRGRTERGAVLQQLFLSRGDSQWQIFSERDLRVLR